MKKFLASFAISAVAALSSANAANIAVFGDNNIDGFLASAAGGSHTVTLVTDTQLATAGFLDSFDLFIYTRDGVSFGSSLSAQAAANVAAFVTGNVVLFTSDLQDDGFPAGGATATLMSNAVNFASNKGFIGEFVGACAAMTSNGAGLEAIGLLAGHCDAMTLIGESPLYGDPMDILQNGHPVVAGVSDPVSLGESHQFFAVLSGVSPDLVIAINSAQIPSIVAGPVQQAVPEPGVLALAGFGLAAAAFVRRRRG